jgi:uracil-DNA glycosylase
MTQAKHPFDAGPTGEPFGTLAGDYPGPEAYPPQIFRVEWGPIFHRGRLDASAKVLVIGQDPGQHESIARRCMVGEAGQRAQGFLSKLGITNSYVIINAYSYSVYGQPSRTEVKRVEPAIAPYRERWLDALLLDTPVQAVIAFGELAARAFSDWHGDPPAKRPDLVVKKLYHPTYPEGSTRQQPDKKPEATKKMLAQWNQALTELHDVLTDPDVDVTLTLYDEQFKDSEKVAIPEADMPAGTPPWMRSLKTWANRTGADTEEKRATVQVKIPTAERIWH